MKGVTYKGKRVLSGRMLPATHNAGINKCYLELDNYGELEVSTSDYFAAIAELQRHAGEKPQGHQHAELMAQYAEDEKTNAEPWRIWQHYALGPFGEDWFECQNHPDWCEITEYRRKPKTKMIHGVEVPDISFAPDTGDFYYHPTISNRNYYASTQATRSKFDELAHRHMMCYPHTEEGKQAAILHAKAMLNIA